MLSLSTRPWYTEVLKTDQATGGFIPHRQLTEELSVFDAEFEACAPPFCAQ